MGILKVIVVLSGLLNVADGRGCKYSQKYKDAEEARQKEKWSKMSTLRIEIIRMHMELVDKHSVAPGTMTPTSITFFDVMKIVSDECYPPIMHKPIYPESEICYVYSEWLRLKFSW